MSNTKVYRAKAYFPEGVDAPFTVATEVAAAATAKVYEILPVNCTASSRVVTPPTTLETGAWFRVVDSRAQAGGANSITIDFSTSNKFQGGTADLVFSTNGESAAFAWSGAPAVGWVRIS